jgi:PAS domain S-box-containing protein
MRALFGAAPADRVVPARMAAAVTMVFGLLCLTGWTLHVPALTSIIPGAVEMKANTALCFVVSGFALLLMTGHASAVRVTTARVFGVFTLMVGCATLVEYLFDRRLGIDELLFEDTGTVYNVFRGRMSPWSAVGFISLGTSLATLRINPLFRVCRLAAILGMVIGSVSLIGYFWNATELTTDRWLPPVAVNSALCFVFQGGGILLAQRGMGGFNETQRIDLAGVEMRMASGFMVAISLLALGGSFTYRASVGFAESVEWIAHSQEVRAALADVYGSLAGAEVAQRDYFLTKESGPLLEYQRLSQLVRTHLMTLSVLIADNPEQVRNLAVLRQTVERRLDILAVGLNTFYTYGLPATRAVLSTSRAMHTIEAVRAQSERMDAVEMHLLTARQAQAAKVRYMTLASLLITLVTASALFIVLFRGIHREMKARRGAEQALRDSDQYNRSVIESSPDCLAVLTTGGLITQMTPQGMRLLNVEDFAAIAGTDWCAFWSGDAAAAAASAVATARNGSPGRFLGSTTRQGDEKWWDVIVMPIRGAGGGVERLLAAARDISEVKRAEDELIAANRFLDSLIESLPVMVALKEAATLKFVRVNRTYERLTGHSRDTLIGKGPEDFFGAAEAEFIVAKDLEALDGGSLIDIPQQTLRTAGGELRTFHTMKVPIPDEDGKPRFLLAISVDISEEKSAEEAIRQLNAALEGKAAQLESTNKELESFSYSVSHDLRAPLRAIDGFAEMIEEDYREKLDTEGLRFLSVIRQNSRRMGALIDDLLQFSRLGRQPVANLDVNVESLVREVVEEVLSQDAGQVRDGSQPKPHIEIGPLPPARGDRTLLRQVWTNLIANAVKYSSKSPHPRIKVSGRRLAEETEYSVCDNGVGFSMEYVEKLFGVFQRLHRADEFSGTGVGLAIVHRVVTRHGGRVWAEGKVNEGAVFFFALPIGDGDG